MYPAITYYPKAWDSPFILTGSHGRIYPFPLHSAPGRTQLTLPKKLPAREKSGGAAKMRRGLLLVTLFVILKLRCSQSRCEETGSRRSTSDTTGLDSLKRNILKRYSDLDYDSFVGLMGRRNTDANTVQSPQKREMHDIFVGLMGRRNSEPDNGPWRREYPERRGIFLNKCRLRFLQGL